MSSSLLDHAFGLRHCEYQKTLYHDGRTTFFLRPRAEHFRCSACGSRNVIRCGFEERTICTVPIGGKPVDLCLPVPRLGCQDCRSVRQANLSFA